MALNMDMAGSIFEQLKNRGLGRLPRQPVTGLMPQNGQFNLGNNPLGFQMTPEVQAQIAAYRQNQLANPTTNANVGLPPQGLDFNYQGNPLGFQMTPEIQAQIDAYQQNNQLPPVVAPPVVSPEFEDLGLATTFPIDDIAPPVVAPTTAPSNLPPSIDPTAVAADPEGYQTMLEGAQAQEAAMPGSTFLAPPVVSPDTNEVIEDTALAPYTGAGGNAFGESPYVGGVVRSETGLDPLTKQMLFGLDGQGGFIPGAMRAAERTFFNADGTPRVVDEQVAGLTADQLQAQELARAGIGIQDPYLQQAQDAYAAGVGALDTGLGRSRSRLEEALGTTRTGLGSLQSGLSEQERITRGAVDQFGTRLGALGRQAKGATDAFGNRIGESEGLMRGTTGAYDPFLTSQFYNPYEDRVVQQTIDDVFEAGEKQDMAQRARDIMSGGESAFGSRARLGATERREALGRGLGEALGGIRSRGFSEAQQTGLGEFARQRQAERLASSGLAGLSGSRLGAQQNLGTTLQGLSGQQLGAQQSLAGGLGSIGAQRMAGQQQVAGSLGNLSNLEAQIGQQQQQAQFGLGANLQGLGQQAQTANQAGVGQLYNIGQQQQGLEQQILDAQRRNQLTAQQAPLAQYQALAPFVGMAPAGQFSTQTHFSPKPSALQAGLATGLGAFGAIGNFMNPRRDG